MAVDDEEDALKIVSQVSLAYPHIKIIVRAHNRASVIQLSKYAGVTCVREVFAGAVNAAEVLLQSFGISESKAKEMCAMFEKHDQSLLAQAAEYKMDMPQMIENSRRGREELQSLFAEDEKSIK